MTETNPTNLQATPQRRPIHATAFNVERSMIMYARLALGAAFLSAVASRFGVWDGHPGLTKFPAFIAYTAEVNSFMPVVTAPYLACVATIAEFSLGLALIAGSYLRWAALGSALLLALFGAAMAISQGVKSPLDYSVFSASAGALLLFLQTFRQPESNT